MREVVIVEAVRSAVGRRNGTLSRTHPVDVLGPLQAAVLERAGVDASTVGQVLGGCINQVGAQAQNVTRLAWLAAGPPEQVAATTMYSACGSSQLAWAKVTGADTDKVNPTAAPSLSAIPSARRGGASSSPRRCTSSSAPTGNSGW